MSRSLLPRTWTGVVTSTWATRGSSLLATSTSTTTTSIPAPPATARTFKTHVHDTMHSSYGRSVTCNNGNTSTSIVFAASNLRRILAEGRVRETVRAQSRFERNHDRKRRLRKERDWATYLRHVRTRVQEAWDMKKQSDLARRHYQDI
jgi:hypothetical protein